VAFKNTGAYINDFFGLIYPNLCLACGNGLKKSEATICTACQYFLPKTDFHFTRGNPIEKIFWGRIKIESATSFYFFNKGSRVQRMIHQLKYHGKQQIGEKVGELFAQDVMIHDDFKNIELIIPVPLHAKKQKKRGYNQADCFAKGIANGSGIQYDSKIITRTVFTDSQTKKSRIDRWINVEEKFSLTNLERVNGKHVLLVDDVVTTGATLEACAQILTANSNASISIATMACAYGA